MFYAVSSSKGKLIWHYPAESAILAGSKIVDQSVIFSSENKFLHCCDKDNGKLIWKAQTKGISLADITGLEKSILIVTRQGWLQNFLSGEVLWQRELGRCVESAPLVSQNMLFIPTVEGDILAYTLAEAEFFPKRSLSA